MLQPRDMGPRQIEGPKTDVAVDDDSKHSRHHTHTEKMTAHTIRRGNAVLMLGQL